MKLNAAIKAAAVQFEKLPKDLSNVVVRSGHGLRLADVHVIFRDSVVATLAQLTHHRSATVRTELRAMLRDMHLQYGVCGRFLVPSASFATHAGSRWVDRVLWAMGTLRVDSSCRRKCNCAYTPICRRCSGRDGSGHPSPTRSMVGTSAFSRGPARTRRYKP